MSGVVTIASIIKNENALPKRTFITWEIYLKKKKTRIKRNFILSLVVTVLSDTNLVGNYR